MTRSGWRRASVVVMAVLLMPATACSSPPPSAPAPSPAVVDKVARLCSAVDGFRGVQVASTDLADSLSRPIAGVAQVAPLLAGDLVGYDAEDAEKSAADIDELRSPRDPELPELDAWIDDAFRRVNDVVPALRRIAQDTQALDPSAPGAADTYAENARRSDALLQSASAAPPDLVARRGDRSTLGTAIGSAPTCAPDGSGPALDGVVPPGPLPPAADGTAYGTCGGGTCQVLVDGQAAFRLGGWDAVVLVANGRTVISGTELATGATITVRQGATPSVTTYRPTSENSLPFTIARAGTGRHDAVLAFAPS